MNHWSAVRVPIIMILEPRPPQSPLNPRALVNISFPNLTQPLCVNNYLDKVIDEPLERGEGTDHDDPRA